MKEIFTSFTNREWAILFWFIILIIFVTTKSAVRNSFAQLLKAIFKKITIIIFSLLLIFIFLQVRIFSLTHLWDNSLIKDLFVWISTFGFGSVINIFNLKREREILYEFVNRNLKLVVFSDLLINFYTFPLIIEIVLVPFAFFLFGIAEYSKRDKKFSIVRKLMNYMIGCIGIVMLLYVVMSFCTRIDDLITIDNMLSFVFPIYLSVTFLPFLYVLALYVFYENIIIVSRHLLRKKKGLGKYFTKKIIGYCKLNLFKLIKFNEEKRRYILNLESEKEIDKLFA